MPPFILHRHLNHFSNRSIFQNFQGVIVLSVILVWCPPTGASWPLILKSMLVAICMCLKSHACLLMCDLLTVGRASEETAAPRSAVKKRKAAYGWSGTQIQVLCAYHLNTCTWSRRRQKIHTDWFMIHTFKSFSEIILLQTCKGDLMPVKRVLLHFPHSSHLLSILLLQVCQ